MIMEDRKQTRLESEYQRLLELKSQSDLFDFEALEGSPPKRYRMTFKFKGIMLHPETTDPCVTLYHVMEVYLPTRYPAEPPYIRWMTPVFHPNVSKGGSVCIGIDGQDWAPSLNLAWLVEQISDMITYRSYNVEDPWNKDAAAWARENTGKFPVDDRSLYKTVALPSKPSESSDSLELMKILNDKDVSIKVGEELKPVIPVVDTSQTTIKVTRIRITKQGETSK